MTTPRTSLRPSTPADADFLRNLFTVDKAAEFAAQGLPETVYQPLIDMQYRGRTATFSAQHPRAATWIIESEGIAAGQYTLEETPQGSRLIDLAILPEYRNHGLATGVLQQLMREAATAGLALRVNKGNPAVRLYTRLGFQVANEDEVSCEMVWQQD
jgi:ribosomal protein S18 acetylase RimI-like enzyme